MAETPSTLWFSVQGRALPRVGEHLLHRRRVRLRDLEESSKEHAQSLKSRTADL